MKALILGAAGMIGHKLAHRLAGGAAGLLPMSELHLVDVVQAEVPPGNAGRVSVADLRDPKAATALIADRPDVIFHLAAIVSGEAEADFDKGYAVNFDGTRNLLDVVRAAHDTDGYTPRLVFASSVAVYGQPLPDVIPDTHHLTPLTSYGTQKAMCELLIADHARRGHLEGVSIRLPTIVVRPGKPNAAASSFFSSIIREPVAGKPAVLPVSDDVRHWFASPRSAVDFLIHAARIPAADLGTHTRLNLPGVAATVGEMIAALENVVGPQAVALIERKPDDTIARIIESWPEAFDPQRALALGFTAETSFEDIIRAYLEDER